MKMGAKRQRAIQHTARRSGFFTKRYADGRQKSASWRRWAHAQWTGQKSGRASEPKQEMVQPKRHKTSLFDFLNRKNPRKF